MDVTAPMAHQDTRRLHMKRLKNLGAALTLIVVPYIIWYICKTGSPYLMLVLGDLQELIPETPTKVQNMPVEPTEHSGTRNSLQQWLLEMLSDLWCYVQTAPSALSNWTFFMCSAIVGHLSNAYNMTSSTLGPIFADTYITLGDCASSVPAATHWVYSGLHSITPAVLEATVNGLSYLWSMLVSLALAVSAAVCYIRSTAIWAITTVPSITSDIYHSASIVLYSMYMFVSDMFHAVAPALWRCSQFIIGLILEGSVWLGNFLSATFAYAVLYTPEICAAFQDIILFLWRATCTAGQFLSGLISSAISMLAS